MKTPPFVGSFSFSCQMVYYRVEVRMASITIALTEERLLKLRETANLLKISPEELIQVSIEELVSQPDKAFQRVADYVLKKNSELYRRLA